MTSRQRLAQGKRLRKIRVNAGLSRAELARLMGLKDPSAVSHWERGAAKPRDVVRFARVCKASLETVLAAGG